jgi:Fe-S-cluster containining protein
MFEGRAKADLIDKANAADRSVYKLKRAAFKAKEAGKSEDEILEDLAAERIRCPLLNDEEQCDMYAYRPITCRLYGIPTAIGGKGHTCGLSGFEPGAAYPTVNLDRIQEKLYEISEQFQKAIKSRHVKLATLLMPLSMALLAEYDETYLGVKAKKSAEEQQGERNDG